LLDAGAGNTWVYTESGGAKFGRSEGLAIASLDMFLSGFFASDGGLKVDCEYHLFILQDMSIVFTLQL
jgi:hypothetical protein